jgi:hypothetical protein
MTEQEFDLRGTEGTRIFSLAFYNLQSKDLNIRRCEICQKITNWFYSFQIFMATDTAKICQVLEVGKIL